MSYRADDPEALEALLSEWGAPASLRQALLDSGYSTLGALAFAVPSSPANAQETFVMNVLGLDPADPAALMLPEAACLRRLLAVASSLQLPGLASVSATPLSPPAISASKLTATEVLSLRRTFQQRYTAELLRLIPCHLWNFCLLSSMLMPLATLFGFPGDCGPLSLTLCPGRTAVVPVRTANSCVIFLKVKRTSLVPLPLSRLAVPQSPRSAVHSVFSLLPCPCCRLYTSLSFDALTTNSFITPCLCHRIRPCVAPPFRRFWLLTELFGRLSIRSCARMTGLSPTASMRLPFAGRTSLPVCSPDRACSIPPTLAPQRMCLQMFLLRLRALASASAPKVRARAQTPLSVPRLKPSLPLSDRLPKISTSPGSSRSMEKRSACALPWVVVATPIASLLTSVQSRWPTANPVAKSILPWTTKKPSID